MKFILALILLVLTSAQVLPAAPNTQLICLAKNIYYEARGEPLAGKLAVAQVTLNRVESNKFGNTICKVVYEKNQFSWTKKPSKLKYGKAWQEALSIAEAAITNGIALQNFDALYFHNKKVKPIWAKQKKKLAKIGGHVFYA